MSGELLEASTYYPNGARETLTTYDDAPPVPLEPMGFTGKEADEEVGVTYFGERWLIPRLGRWATPDPLHVHASGGGEALNSYHYVGGNLLQARDELGLEPRLGPIVRVDGLTVAGVVTQPQRASMADVAGAGDPATAQSRMTLQFGTFGVYVAGQTGALQDVHVLQFVDSQLVATDRTGRHIHVQGEQASTGGGVDGMMPWTTDPGAASIEVDAGCHGVRCSRMSGYFDVYGGSLRQRSGSGEVLSTVDAPTLAGDPRAAFDAARRQGVDAAQITLVERFTDYVVRDGSPNEPGSPQAVLARIDFEVVEVWGWATGEDGSSGPVLLTREIVQTGQSSGAADAPMDMAPEHTRALTRFNQDWGDCVGMGDCARPVTDEPTTP